MEDIWNPKQYQQFSTERTRPALDLLAQVNISSPRLIYDLGCGTGHITQLLQERWPKARVIGIDSSAVMLEKARVISNTIEWIEADITTWQPTEPADLIFSNAALHWLNNHETVFPNLVKNITPQGTLAIQMPRNFHSSSHLCIIEVAKRPQWRERVLPLLRFSDPNKPPVAESAFYYEIFAPLVNTIDIWETEYFHPLKGLESIVEWMKGTGLRPVLKALNETDTQKFFQDYIECLSHSYIPDPQGTVLFPFRRMFMVASKA